MKLDYIGRLAYSWMFLCFVILWMHFFKPSTMSTDHAVWASLIAATLSALAFDYSIDLIIYLASKETKKK